MSRFRRHSLSLLALCLVSLAACGNSSSNARDSGADVIAPHDAAAGDTHLPPADLADTTSVADAGCPLPVGEVPGTEGQGAMGSVLRGAIPTAPNRVAVFVGGTSAAGNAVRAVAWDGATWSTHDVTPNWSPTGIGQPIFAQQGGHPIVFAPMETTPQPFWIELPSGDYSAAQTITGLTHNLVNAAAWFPADNMLLAAAADNQGGGLTVALIERGADDSLHVEAVDVGSTPSVRGVGRMTDLTPWIAVERFLQDLSLWRRAGSSWSIKQTLLSATEVGRFDGLGVWAPTSGSGKGLTLFIGRNDGVDLWGQTWSTDTGAPAGNTLLVDEIGNGVARPSVLYDVDGEGITFIVHRTVDGRAWIGRAQGSAFETTQELRPDLIFDDPPLLFRSACGEAMIAYHARTNAQDPRSQPVKIERLVDFRSH